MSVPLYQKLIWLACFCLLLMTASVFLLASMMNRQDMPAAAAYTDLQVKTKMLTAALGEVGVCSPRDAALLWAKGIKLRNAALQYAVLSGPLKERFLKAWEQTAPGWVTGVSSPWISKYELNSEHHRDGIYTYVIVFTADTSTGTAGTYTARITVEADHGFWRITHIDTDDAFRVYMGDMDSPHQ